MGEVTGISWCDHTFNPWMGCQRVSPGCEHCYAEAFVTGRMGHPVWGPSSTTPRKRTSVSNWRQPVVWNRRAAEDGVRRRVFCASLADVFEDHPQVKPWREELFELIERTPALDWLLLTKRPEMLRWHRPTRWDQWPRNVWLGTTAEDQQRARERLPWLLEQPAVVHFLSCEPLIGPVDLARIGDWWCRECGVHLSASRVTHEERCDACGTAVDWDSVLESPSGGPTVQWVIGGGESGPSARTSDVAWHRTLLRQCAEAGVAYFEKQLGSRPVNSSPDEGPWPVGVAEWRFVDRKGGNPVEWPDDLRVRQFPQVAA